MSCLKYKNEDQNSLEYLDAVKFIQSNQIGVMLCSGVLVLTIAALTSLLLTKLLHNKHIRWQKLFCRYSRADSQTKVCDVASASLISSNKCPLEACNCHRNSQSFYSNHNNRVNTKKRNSCQNKFKYISPYLHNKYSAKTNNTSCVVQQKRCNVTDMDETRGDETGSHQDFDKESFITASSIDTHQTGATPIVNRKLKDPLHIINEIQIPRTSITLKRLIIEGTFCQMYEAIMITSASSRSKRNCQKVLIKTLAEASNCNQAAVLIRDGTLLAGLRHRHLCSVIGAASALYDDHHPQTMLQAPWLIYPLPLPGNLKLMLHNRHPHQYNNSIDTEKCVINPIMTFSTPCITSFALQILRALKYLHTRGIIHRDVAARNCFLKEEDQLQLCDSALSRDLFPEDYHCLGDNENRPVKWLSVEALVQRRFSPASDVWSFGVFAWELVTGAALPYSEIDPFEMPTFLRNGLRLKQPGNCPDMLWKIISHCWNDDFDKRPKIVEIIRKFKNFQKFLSDFV